MLTHLVQKIGKAKKGSTKRNPRPSLAATAKVSSERVFIWGDSNLRDLVLCDEGMDLFDGIPNHLVRAN